MLCIYRNTSGGSGEDIQLSVDGKPVEPLRNDAWSEFVVAPGEHQVAASSPTRLSIGASTRLQLRDGEVRAVKVIPGFGRGLFDAYGTLRLETPQMGVARREISADCELAVQADLRASPAVAARPVGAESTQGPSGTSPNDTGPAAEAPAPAPAQSEGPRSGAPSSASTDVGVGPDSTEDGQADSLEGACAAGDGSACRQMGLAAARGDGRPRDEPYAVHLLKQACALGNHSACEEVNAMLESPAGELPPPVPPWHGATRGDAGPVPGGRDRCSWSRKAVVSPAFAARSSGMRWQIIPSQSRPPPRPQPARHRRVRRHGSAPCRRAMLRLLAAHPHSSRLPPPCPATRNPLCSTCQFDAPACRATAAPFPSPASGVR